MEFATTICVFAWIAVAVWALLRVWSGQLVHSALTMPAESTDTQTLLRRSLRWHDRVLAARPYASFCLFVAALLTVFLVLDRT